MDYRTLLQTFLRTMEDSIAVLEKTETGASPAAQRRSAGQRGANKDIAGNIRKLLEAPQPVAEANVRALCVMWRGQAIKEFSAAFQGEMLERYKSRVSLGMAYAYALASIELEQYLRTQKRKEAEGGTAA